MRMDQVGVPGADDFQPAPEAFPDEGSHGPKTRPEGLGPSGRQPFDHQIAYGFFLRQVFPQSCEEMDVDARDRRVQRKGPERLSRRRRRWAGIHGRGRESHTVPGSVNRLVTTVSPFHFRTL